MGQLDLLNGSQMKFDLGVGRGIVIQKFCYPVTSSHFLIRRPLRIALIVTYYS
jgi:hypothetical protein